MEKNSYAREPPRIDKQTPNQKNTVPFSARRMTRRNKITQFAQVRTAITLP